MKIIKGRRKYYLVLLKKVFFFVMLIMIGVISGIFFMKIKNGKFARERRMDIYALKRDVEAGEVLENKDIYRTTVINEGRQVSSTNLQNCIGKPVKQALIKGTVLNGQMFETEDIEKGIRKIPYTFIHNSDILKKGDLVDIRISFPNGADFIILSKKEVIRLEERKSSGERVLWLGVNEEEILRMSSGVVDAYLFEGAYIYAVIYTSELQNSSIVNYPVNKVVEELIKKDPNIIHIAQDKKTYELRKRIYENAPNLEGEKEIVQGGLKYFD